MTEFRDIERERRVTRDEAADFIIEVGERLKRDGVVEVGGEEIPVPDELELEVEYEEDPGENEFEVELEWRPREGGEEAGETSEEDATPAGPSEGETPGAGAGEPLSVTEQGREEPLPPYIDVKEEMDEVVKAMHRAVTAHRELPGRDALDRFLELNDAFERYAADEPYADRMEEYSAKVGAMERAYEEGDVERFHGRVEDVLASMDACHVEYK